MAGDKKERVVLNDRDLRMFRVLVTLRFLDVEQLAVAGSFNSWRRAKRRAQRLYRAGLLRRWFVASRGGAPKAIYGLSLAGAKLVDAGRDTVLAWKDGDLIVASQFLAHQQALTQVLLATKSEAVAPIWKTFRQPLSTVVPLRPDAYVEFPGEGQPFLPVFLEVDRGTEPLKVWDHKAMLYLKLAASREFERLFQKSRFDVLVIVTAEGRLNTIRETVALRTEKLFWFSTLDSIIRDGLWAARWLRPKGEAEVTLA